MVYDESRASAIGVPLPGGTALEEEILSGSGGLHNVITAVEVDGLEGVGSDRKRNPFAQAKFVAVDGVVVGGSIAVVVLVAGVHKPEAVPQSFASAAAAGVVGVVEVREAEGVAVLVAEGADGGHQVGGVGRAHKLGRAGVGIDGDSVKVEGLADVAELVGVGPDAVGVVGLVVGFVLAGEPDEDVVHLAVAVVVVFGEIDG